MSPPVSVVVTKISRNISTKIKILSRRRLSRRWFSKRSRWRVSQMPLYLNRKNFLEVLRPQRLSSSKSPKPPIDKAILTYKEWSQAKSEKTSLTRQQLTWEEWKQLVDLKPLTHQVDNQAPVLPASPLIDSLPNKREFPHLELLLSVETNLQFAAQELVV